MELTERLFPVSRVHELETQPPEEQWLIDSIWAQAAVGIIGGAPKCCKSWFGLDMAVSVASGSPCLDRFEVRRKGTVLIYLAEDTLSSARSRIEALCAHRRLDLRNLDLYVITVSSLRLDLKADQQRLNATLETFTPRLLILDPLVRLHRLDENSAAEISSLLGFSRDLRRAYNTAIVLVHHANKKHYAQPGQALRGSSDLRAFGDSNAYLARKNQRLVLTLEHRAAKAPEPIELEPRANEDNAQARLHILSSLKTDPNLDLRQRLIALLKQAQSPLRRAELRETLKVNNLRLGQTLLQLEKQGIIFKNNMGWMILNSEKDSALRQQINLALPAD